MGQYEPNDSRKVTLTQDTAPGEPARTGTREGESRRQPEKQKNLAQEETGGDLPDPKRAERGYDQDEG